MKRGVVVASITLGMLLAALDQMIMSTAMPEVQKILGDIELYSWVFSAYMLSSTITVPIYGKLADRFGRKKVYLFALGLFLIGSALCALSATMWQLVLFRVIQGLGAGGVLPLTVTIAGDLYDIKNRGKIQGLFSSMWAVAGIAGPVVGGWIIENTHWSWIFWLNIPVGILAMIGFTLAFEEQGEGEKTSIDYLGALLLIIAIGTLLFATLAQHWLEIIGLVISSAILFVLFINHQRTKEFPLIRIEMFQNPLILWLNVSGMIVTMGLFVVPFFIPLLAQDVLGYSPLASGLILMGQVLGWNIGAVPAGKFILKVGYKKAILTGIVLLLVGGSILALFVSVLNYTLLLIVMFILGLGFGVSVTAFTIGVQEAVDWKERGVSTSIQLFSRNIGTTVGVAIVGAILNLAQGGMELIDCFRIVFIVALLITSVSLWTTSKIPMEKHLEHNQ
ncbi:MDR family MFS transporter [Ammoniphilus sp. CFH 90114]|uniref:MDR family MFS transporter n=1 Tax=Ammoniphilus sp. CFH 90114 TaxID=2493665 RepID=UPI00100F0143|nr:MDR family MFS transporter [Ammoniphilus sp. CFH 90114]RXT04894.1 MFS transporter [Ammoniphilus sp. CFH 90114]